MKDKPRQFSAYLFSGPGPARETFWRPAADIYRIRGGWLLKFDLAGVRPEDVTVEVKGCQVTVSGVRRDMTLEENASYYSMEIAYNRFERTVELPCDFSNSAVAMENRNGLLIIRLTTEEER